MQFLPSHPTHLSCASQVPVATPADYAELFWPHNPGTMPPNFSVQKALEPCIPNRGLPGGNYSVMGPLTGAVPGVAGACALPTEYTPVPPQAKPMHIVLPPSQQHLGWTHASQSGQAMPVRGRPPYVDTLF